MPRLVIIIPEDHSFKDDTQWKGCNNEQFMISSRVNQSCLTLTVLVIMNNAYSASFFTRLLAESSSKNSNCDQHGVIL